MIAELSDLPLIIRVRKYREMAVKARSEAQAATWFLRRWSYRRQAHHWENLVTEGLKELRTEIVRANRAKDIEPLGSGSTVGNQAGGLTSTT